jgi:hypothetical protein
MMHCRSYILCFLEMMWMAKRRRVFSTIVHVLTHKCTGAARSPVGSAYLYIMTMM